MREKLDMLTLRCLCRVVGLGQLGSRHVVGNGRFRGHSVCTLYSGHAAQCINEMRVGGIVDATIGVECCAVVAVVREGQDGE